MAFIDDIKQISTEIEEKISKANDYSSTKEIYNEANTRKALIEPLIECLGYDVTNPLEVFSESTADAGSSKAKKVDYIIYKDRVASILIECKALGTPLDERCRSQLVGYFQNTPEAHFAILTDGCKYLLYKDKDGKNIMDKDPYLTFDIRDHKQSQVDVLEKLHKGEFDVETTTDSAKKHGYRIKIKERLEKLFESPSDEFCKLLADGLHSGSFRSEKKRIFRPLVKKMLKNFFDDEVNNRLATLRLLEEPAGTEQPEEAPEDEDDGIVTTEEEIQGHRIIRAILAGTVGTDSVTMRDHKTYCSILFEDNNRKTVCRFYFDGEQMKLGLFDAKKKEEKHPVDKLSDLYNFSSQLIETVKRYL